MKGCPSDIETRSKEIPKNQNNTKNRYKGTIPFDYANAKCRKKTCIAEASKG